jgi:23S rRNA (adenine2503-C2)-methyltransferase
VNDRPRDATELAAIATDLRAHVNLIPLNPTPGYPTVGSRPEVVRRFRDQLTGLGVNATIRRNRGTDIDAACGQLRARVVSEHEGHEAHEAAVTVLTGGRTPGAARMEP